MRKGHHRPHTDKMKGQNRPQAPNKAERTTQGHRPQARRRTTGHTEKGEGQETRPGHMEETQLKLNFDPGARTRRDLHSPQSKPSKQKEELLHFIEHKEDRLIHYRQGNTNYCALYTLATLEGLDPNHIIKIAKKTVSGTRTRYTGQFWQIRNTYCILGYYFPFDKIPDPDTQRTREVDSGQFSGRGHFRIQKRKASLIGHQACYKNGIIYDSSESGPQPARFYLTDLIKKRYHYIVIKPQVVL